MIPRWIDRIPAFVPIAFVFALYGSVASAQFDPVQIYPLPGQHEWTAIPGAANMDQDPADEIVLVNEASQLVIVDSASGEIQFDSEPYGWNSVYAPGWEREGTSTYHRNHGNHIFCDEDGDGVYCINVIVSVASPYQNQLAVICLDRNLTSTSDTPVDSQLTLKPNFPNPLAASTQIDFSLAEGGPAVVRVLDAEGRLVRTLLDEVVPAGDRSVTWDGRNDEGRAVSSGVYFYDLEAGGLRTSRKAVLLK